MEKVRDFNPFYVYSHRPSMVGDKAASKALRLTATAVVDVDANQIKVGFSLQSNQDKFIKRIGRRVSEQRAMKNPNLSLSLSLHMEKNEITDLKDEKQRIALMKAVREILYAQTKHYELDPSGFMEMYFEKYKNKRQVRLGGKLTNVYTNIK